MGTTQPETYDALRTGVADGAMSPMEALQGFKWGEVIKYTTLDYPAGYSTGMFIVMNKNRWNAIPPDVQKVFTDVSAEWIDKTGALWDQIEQEGKDYTLKRGNKIIPLSGEETTKWAAKVKPLVDDYVKSTKAKGLPGDEVIRFCHDTLKVY